MYQANSNSNNLLDSYRNRLIYSSEQIEIAKRRTSDYLEYLQQQYVISNPQPYLPIDKQLTSNRFVREPVIDRLATNLYHWDLKIHRNCDPVRRQSMLEIRNKVPLSGFMLNSDLQRMKACLAEISYDLYQLRTQRLSLSTHEFFQQFSLNDTQWEQQIGNYYNDIAEIKQRIYSIGSSVFEGNMATISDIKAMRMDQILENCKTEGISVTDQKLNSSTDTKVSQHEREMPGKLHLQEVTQSAGALFSMKHEATLVDKRNQLSTNYRTMVDTFSGKQVNPLDTDSDPNTLRSDSIAMGKDAEMHNNEVSDYPEFVKISKDFVKPDQKTTRSESSTGSSSTLVGINHQEYDDSDSDFYA